MTYQGFDQFQMHLERWARAFPEITERALNAGADLVVREAQMKHLRGPTSSGGGFENETLSRRTSRLFMSITKRVRVQQSASLVTAEVGSNVPYARIHEYGGRAGRNHASRIPQRPYLRPSIHAKQTQVRELILDRLMEGYRAR